MMTIVETRFGKLEGSREGNALRFAGIPFAKAKRWQMPVPPDGWTGVRDATKFAAIAVQDEKQPDDILKGPPGPHSEDCLHLNIWTPACDGAKRPVMVWIHGGGFTAGASNIGAYDGTSIATRGDVVLVSINYRLGVLGFLNLRDASKGALPGTGAEGIADQVAALFWIKDNIAAFGGDPDNVTVFGESAGGASVSALLASPQARGLFQKAICESGAAHVGQKREDSAKIAERFLEKLGATADPSKAVEASTARILKAQQDLIADPPKGAANVSLAPTIDGKVLPMRAIDAIRAGSAKGIALMAGSNKDETRLMFLGNRKLNEMDAEVLERRVSRLAGDAADALIAAYKEATPADAFAAIMGDNLFWIPTLKLLEAQSSFGPTFGYRVDWPSPLLGGQLGACHVIEIGFVFGTHARAEVARFFGTGSDADALSIAMMDAWIAFARNGDPSTGALDWPGYDAKRRATLIFGDGEPKVVDDPAKARRLAWGGSEGRLGF
jgi:para-nitrobenzyl esterase